MGRQPHHPASSRGRGRWGEVITLGYDPGMTLAETECALWDGKEYSIGNPSALISAVVIERPVAQGQLRKQGPLYDTCITVGYLAGTHDNGVYVYLVPRQIIMAQLEYTTKAGNADSWLLSYFKHTCKFPTGRGTALNSTHARAALAAAMFRWQDPRNERYRYNP